MAGPSKRPPNQGEDSKKDSKPKINVTHHQLRILEENLQPEGHHQ